MIGEGLHQRLAAELADGLAEPALRCEEGEVRELDRDQVIRVSDFDVQTAARCQAKAAAPPSGFEASIFTTSRAVALRSMRWLRRKGSVIDAVGHTMRLARGADDSSSSSGNSSSDGDRDGDGRGLDDGHTPSADWLGEYLSDPDLAPIDVRVRIAARATTWLTTTLDVLGVEDPAKTQGWRYDIRPGWTYPGRGLALAGRVDLSLPVIGNHTPVFVLSSLHPAVLDQAAFNICLWTIRQRKAPDEVLVVELPTATLHRLATDELFDRGIEAAVRAADAVTARPADSEHGGSAPARLARTPSGFTCARCPWAATCAAKAEFDRQPAFRGGIQLEPSPRPTELQNETHSG